MRCERCGSPRIVRHAELYSLHLAHIDCDAFYAAVEKRDNPALRDKPVIVGGGKRGVVSTACYIARIHGVRSAMPMFKALEACPEAIVVKPDMEKYVRVGREVRAMMLALTPLVEPISIDEAFLDLAGTEKLHGLPPALVLARFAQAVEKEIGITVSAGLSYCKFLAKIASDFRKPRGYAVIGEEEAVSFLAEQPVTMTLWGHRLTLTTARGVFSRDGLDTGTGVLLRTVPPPRAATRLLDLGCGIGPLALALALECPAAHVTAVDVNDLAVALTARNAAAAGVGDRVTACRPDEVPGDVRFDEIWSNPPIRVGKAALHALLLTWLPRLEPHGAARLVVARNLGADSLAAWLGEQGFDVRREASAKGFRVLTVRPRTT